MEDDAPILHPSIVAAPDDRAAMHEHRPDRNAALAQPLLGLGDGGAQEVALRAGYSLHRPP